MEPPQIEEDKFERRVPGVRPKETTRKNAADIQEGMMMMTISNKQTGRFLNVLIVALIAAVIVPMSPVKAQQQASPAAPPARPAANGAAPAPPGDADNEYYQSIYTRFYETYRLGPADVIAIRVTGQPDYSFDNVVVSPVGRIYHPLLGDVYVANMNVEEVTEKLTTSLSQFIINPKVSVSLIEANSAKIGVIGEVRKPGIVIMSRPMTLLEAISEAGGATEFGKQSNVTLVRMAGDGRMVKREINLKHILQAKGAPEDNLTMYAGDVVVVGENWRRKILLGAALVGFGGFAAYIAK
ncbi:MAG TPA: polysaccharide biosynthesis/export family protein [Blastocatellia bacterium]